MAEVIVLGDHPKFNVTKKVYSLPVVIRSFSNG